MTYWHMQLHPDKPDQAIDYANWALEKEVIELDFDITGTFAEDLMKKPLDQWSNNGDFERCKEAHKEKFGKPGVSQFLKDFKEIRKGC